VKLPEPPKPKADAPVEKSEPAKGQTEIPGSKE
jgi:hypothetical protein